ncbi:unnamed protein product [Caenorhabditis brenneri]
MLFPKLLLCTVAAMAWGYGNSGGSGYTGGSASANANYGAYPQPIYVSYDDYSSEEHHKHHKKSCKSKLHHYDLTAKDPAHSILEAKWKPVEKDGKDFTLITCPADCQNCALVAEADGNTATISTTQYQDTALLADGFKTGILAKCHGKKTTFVLDNDEKIVIKNVACIKYPETPLPCTLCNIDLIKPGFSPRASFASIDQAEGQCKKTVVTCTPTPGYCKIQVKAHYIDGTSDSTPSPAASTSATAEFFCQNDGTYKISLDGFTKSVKSIECVRSGTGPCV